MNFHRMMFPMQLNWQIAQLQKFWITTAAVSFNLATATYLESLKLSGVSPLDQALPRMSR